MRKGNSIILYFLAGLLLMIVYCGNSPTAGNGSQTPNSIYGILYNPDGSRAAHATIFIITSDHDPKPLKGKIRAIVDTTTTNDTGAFFLDSLPDGYYNIVGKGDSGVSYNDSVFIQGDTTTDNLSDTLRSSGTLSGVVRLQPGDDSRTVFILVFGTQTWITPIDSIGNFTLSLAEGTYHVRFLTTLDDYNPLDTNLIIRAGMYDTLSDTIFLPYTGIPIPTGLTLTYDTLKQIVTLTWDKADTTLVKGYNVYRKHSDSDFVKINPALITETTYSDSSVIQDESYEYKITAVDNGDNEGKKSEGVNVKIVSGFELADSIIISFSTPPNLLTFEMDRALNFLIPMGDTGYGDFITVFNQSGDSIRAFGEGHFSNDLRFVRIDSKENAYCSARSRHRVVKFDPTGVFLLEWDTRSPDKMDIDNQDNIFIISSSHNAIIKYDSSGTLIDSVGYPNAEDNGKMVIGPNGKIYDASYADDNIRVFNNDLTFEAELNLSFGETPLYRIHDIDNEGNFYLADVKKLAEYEYAFSFYIYNSKGQFMARWGRFILDNNESWIWEMKIVSQKVYVMIDNKTNINILVFSIPANL